MAAFGQQQEDSATGTHGLKRDYVQSTPVVTHAPMKYETTLEARDVPLASNLSNPAIRSFGA